MITRIWSYRGTCVSIGSGETGGGLANRARAARLRRRIIASDLEPQAEEIGRIIEFSLDRPARDLAFREFERRVGDVLGIEAGDQIGRDRVGGLQVEPE